MITDDKKNKRVVFTTELVDFYTKKINDGYILKSYENPWLDNEIGVRRAGLSFKRTSQEQEEYIKCAIDIIYFANNYCKTKSEDGSIKQIKLRDYQVEILNNFVNYNNNILFASRQVGKTITTSIFLLHTMLFNNDKNIIVVSNKYDTSLEILDKLKTIYKHLPFFLKSGAVNWNIRSLIFENGCKIKALPRSAKPAIGFTIDVLYIDEFAHIPSNIIEPYYKSVYPTVTAVKGSKIIISSTPEGMNLFYKLVMDAERPEGDPQKNTYKCTRVYWYQVPERFVTYIKLIKEKLDEYNLTKEDIYNIIYNKWSSVTKVVMEYSTDKQAHIISVYNNDNCKEEDVKTFKFIINDKEVPISNIATLSTWKEEIIKDLGEDGFNQEYGLRFTNSSKSLIDEKIINNMMKNKKRYIFNEIPILNNKLRFDYSDLKWVDDILLFNQDLVKEYKIIMSIDLSEGLGQDYSVINIFKVSNKDLNIIDNEKNNYKSIVDYFKLDQIGLYRSNIISIDRIAELFYLLVFEYFNSDNVKVVLELNTYGHVFLSELKNVFNGNNNYSPHIFFRYKHRLDSNEEKIGLKVNDNKNNILIKKYQDILTNNMINVTNEDTIFEISNFVRNVSSNGTVKYCADIGYDDIVMTIVNVSTIFDKDEYKMMLYEIVDNPKLSDSNIKNILLNNKNIDNENNLNYSIISDVLNSMRNRYLYNITNQINIGL